jgi:hypothetical protein
MFDKRGKQNAEVCLKLNFLRLKNITKAKNKSTLSVCVSVNISSTIRESNG